MVDTKEVFTNWIVEYLKSKDIMTKQITAIKKNEQNVDVFIEGTLRNQFVVIQQTLTETNQFDLINDKHIVLVTANTRENMEFLIKNWSSFVKYQHLCIYFINPKSSADKRWIIFPATHDKITDKKFLRKGIESLFTTVDPWKG